MALVDKASLTAGIVHLGLGAFARAHLIAATEAAMAASGERHWGVLGVSLRHPDVRDALAPYRFDYTLALRDADEHGTPRERRETLHSLLGVLVAPEDPPAVLEAIAAPATRIVSLTVTEKGYHHDPATGALKRDDPGLAHDLVHPRSPRTTLGFLVHGLALRHARGLGPVTLLSLRQPAEQRPHAARPGAGLRGAGGCGAGRLDRQRLPLPERHGRPHRVRRTTTSRW